ncbi:carbohydrate-binding module family 5 protein [Mucor lusitanicus]|uniref:Carbohydrate-binding module family 5 protein n=1 Tax=Mucor circinelloides f. lusitanicus TaxID=29924 RepID=A0A8H4BR23_MUCCL|nr:carbohydrate-binding module family 5 protein [Mucor lusitanicus]
MKLTGVLAKVACGVLLLLNGVSTAPTNSLQSRAAGSSKVIVGYFPNWLYQDYLPSQIDFKKYTHIYYAFALQVKGNVPIWEDPEIMSEDVEYGFPALVKAAKAAGTKVTISVGGWTGSTQFSPMAASASNRAAWIKWNVDLVTKYDTAGVDIDWEYPTADGPGCNTKAWNDVDNLLLLVKELRVALDAASPTNHKEITMAVRIIPWGGETDATDVSAFVPYVDRFHVMTFDVNGAWNSISGPNSPFKVESGKGFQKGFVEGIEYWKSAGVPYNKLAGGVAFYGRAQTLTITSNPTTQYNPAVSPNPPLGDSNDGPWTNPFCSSDSSPASGEWKYKNLRSQGVLTSPTVAASPWIRHFDNITQTPWLYNPTNKQYISYDDPVSVGVKTQWAVSKDLAGLFVWSLEQDNGELIAAMQPVIGGNPPPTSTTSTVGPTSTSTSTSTVTTSTSTKTTTTTTPTTSPATCNGIAVYNASTAYNGGVKVTYNGNIYISQWWTQGETPSPSGPAWSAWKYVGPC